MDDRSNEASLTWAIRVHTSDIFGRGLILKCVCVGGVFNTLAQLETGVKLYNLCMMGVPH